jgi:1A family penicillin-binding protein
MAKHEIQITSYKNPKEIEPKKKSKKLALKIIFGGLGLFIIAIFLMIGFAILGLYLKYSYEFTTIKPRSNSTQLVMYDKNGEEFFRGYGAAEPVRIELKDVPEVVKKATLAAEDINFYNHGPIDFRGVARAIYLNYQNTSGSTMDRISAILDDPSMLQGGSTITQQLVKNIYLSNEKSLERKFKEIVFASKLEEKYSKDKILEMYLNEIYYGEQALGIQNAAKIFFNKDMRDLSLSEASLLAGLPQAPTYYSPFGENYDAAKKRQEYVLQQMLANNIIDIDKAKSAANEPLALTGEELVLDKYPYFSQYTKEELSNLLGSENIESKGLKVYTTLDQEKQKIVETKLKEGIVKLANRGASNSASVVADPKNNTILAMVGGVDWNKSKVNVTTSNRQPGSSFKPLVYATGLENGFTAATILNDKAISFPGNPPYAPKNYNGSFSGYVTVRNALARSLNTTAVEMAALVGIDKVIAQAQKMGISTLNQPAGTYGLSLALGAGEVKLVDMVTAYSAFADGGQTRKLTAIEKVINSKGDTLKIERPKEAQVISPQTAYIISSILSDNDARSATFGSSSPLKTPKITAVKTGTTDDYVDSWTMGYSPDFVVGVWLGNNDHTPMKKVSGVEGAAYLWNEIITNVMANTESKPFAKPEGLSEKWISPYTGGTTNSQTKPNILEYFKAGTEPTSAKPDLGYLKRF